MPFLLWEGDLTTYAADAIVNAVSPSLPGEGADGAICSAAGPELPPECRVPDGCETGKARRTPGCRLPCTYIIHTVGPVWQDGKHGEPELLASCYRESLKLANESGCRSVAFPLISAGACGCPRDVAWRIARESISGFLTETDPEMTVTMVVPDRRNLRPDNEDADRLSALLKSREEPPTLFAAYSLKPDCFGASPLPNELKMKRKPARTACYSAKEAVCEDLDLDERIRSRDESFTEMLLRKIDESGMTDAQCYRLANIDRKLFSKIRSDRFYRPSKQTAVAFAFALRLSNEETRDLLRKAGFALSDSTTFDLIIGYFLEKGEYDLMTVNEALFQYDQPLLGR